ncbi:hypothetical protein GJAV_G00034750 [Gymnothorax javanicus]|nr:hypothetical protein GJAV_G00034750 [Gymnothorax javanicus]
MELPPKFAFNHSSSPSFSISMVPPEAVMKPVCRVVKECSTRFPLCIRSTLPALLKMVRWKSIWYAPVTAQLTFLK